MAPLPKVASQPPTKGDGLVEDGDAQQYGRSSSSLNVELAAGGVRESDRRNSQGSHRSPSAPKLLCKKSSKSTSSPNPRFAGSANPPPPPPDRRTSYAPAVSSPLNPTILIESVEARVGNERKTSDESNSSTSPPQGGGGTGETFTGRTPPRPSLRRPIASKSPGLRMEQHLAPATVVHSEFRSKRAWSIDGSRRVSLNSNLSPTGCGR